VPAERRAVLDAMATLTVELFDRRFIDQIGIADHTADLALFETAARQASDPALRIWADRMVPVLRNHLDAAHQLPMRQLARA
jgi:putative membrane protein